MSLTHYFLRMMDVRAMPDDPYPPKQLGPFIWHFMRQMKAGLALLVVLSLFSSAANALGPFLLRHIVDIMLSTPNVEAAWQKVLPILVIYLVVVLGLSWSMYFAMSFVRATTYNSGMTHVIRRQLYWLLMQQSWTFFQNDFAGRLANKIMEVGSEIRNLVNSGRRMVWVFVMFTVGGISLAIANPVLLIPFFIWLVGYGLAVTYMVPKVKKLARIFSDTRSACVGRMVDGFTNIQTVKLFANQGQENDDLSEVLHNARLRHADVQLANFKLDVMTGTLEAFLIGSLLLTSIYLWSQGLASAGTVAMSLPLALLLASQSAMLREELGAMLESLGTIEDAMNTLIHPIAITDSPHALPLKVETGQLVFREVAFRYSPTQPLVIERLNLVIPAGQKVGLVGPSGAGKSTLINLLLRFFEVTEGTISIDAQDIREVTQDSLRAHIGVVTQDTSLLHRTIAENIGYGCPQATLDDIVTAARKAQAHEFILNLVDKDGRSGYEARVGERGVKLSGGQRQRIAIARLILKNAPILILDEATSALDSEAEQAIQENLAALMEGKTVIAIAHRLSTISQMDRLLVLEHGQIVEDGTHRDLLAHKGLYAKLWARQSGGFLPEEDISTLGGEGASA